MRPYVCIPLRGERGGVAYVNESLWPLVDGFHWYQTESGYAFSPKLGFMHRRVTAAEPYETIDHKNFNRLDNRLENLRCLVGTLNNKHRQKRKTRWPYKGIRQLSATGSWHARIVVDRKERHLGSYPTPEEAAVAYDKAALAAFGFLAVLNFGDTQ